MASTSKSTGGFKQPDVSPSIVLLIHLIWGNPLMSDSQQFPGFARPPPPEEESLIAQTLTLLYFILFVTHVSFTREEWYRTAERRRERDPR